MLTYECLQALILVDMDFPQIEPNFYRRCMQQSLNVWLEAYVKLRQPILDHYPVLLHPSTFHINRRRRPYLQSSRSRSTRTPPPHRSIVTTYLTPYCSLMNPRYLSGNQRKYVNASPCFLPTSLAGTQGFQLIVASRLCAVVCNPALFCSRRFFSVGFTFCSALFSSRIL